MPDPESDPQMHKVKSEDPDDGFAWKHEDDITDEDEMYDKSDGHPEPSDELVDVVGTKRANALARGDVTTVEEALSYEGDLTDLDDVGQGTVDSLLEAADE